MNGEVTTDDVYALVDRRTESDITPTADEIAVELDILPAEAVEHLFRLERNGKIETSEREDGETVWSAGRQMDGVG